jgi:hypothetical protein
MCVRAYVPTGLRHHDWKGAQPKIPWGTIILFGVGISLGTALLLDQRGDMARQHRRRRIRPEERHGALHSRGNESVSGGDSSRLRKRHGTGVCRIGRISRHLQSGASTDDIVHGSAFLRNGPSRAGKCRVSERPAFDVRLLRQLLWAEDGDLTSEEVASGDVVRYLLALAGIRRQPQIIRDILPTHGQCYRLPLVVDMRQSLPPTDEKGRDFLVRCAPPEQQHLILSKHELTRREFIDSKQEMRPLFNEMSECLHRETAR